MELIERVSHRLRSRSVFDTLFAANFVLALHLFLVVYINSSYLTNFVPERFVGLIYIGGSVLGLTFLLFITRVLRHFGNWRTLIALSLVELLIFIGFAFLGNAFIVLALFVIYLALYPLILFTLDIFLESYTKQEETTGNIRGIFLTTTNTALIISPLIAGFILGDENYWRVFLVSAFFLLPFLAIIVSKFRTFQDPEYQHFNVKNTFLCIKANKNISTIFKAHFIMRLFFSWMVIYTPIYLNQHIGFDWPTIGVIFTIMLLPYLLLELPAGRIADRYLGERELLVLGFIITAIFVALMSFFTEANVVVWAAILFMTRVGAALLEIMTETYFFKHVDEEDANTISGFRMIRPLAYIIGPVLATVVLFFIDIQYLFLVFAAVILFGLRYALVLKDTK